MKTPEEFAELMNVIVMHESDKEERHIMLDSAMVAMLKELGYGEGAEVWENTDMWFA